MDKNTHNSGNYSEKFQEILDNSVLYKVFQLEKGSCFRISIFFPKIECGKVFGIWMEYILRMQKLGRLDAHIRKR